MIADTHIHTRFSTDSKEEPEAHIKKAIELGMKELCFTDHYDMDFPDGLFVFDVDEYFKEMNALKEKYKGRIDVHVGIELGLKSNISERLLEFVKKYPFEFVIGSVHLVDEKDPYERELFDMSDDAMYERYFETCLECLESCSGIDAFGHLDYVVRYGYDKDKAYSYDRYAGIIDDILKTLIRKNIALEINTAGKRKGLRYVHPYPDILKRYKELGGSKVSIGSDAHSAGDLGYYFEDIISYLGKFGIEKKDIIGFERI